MNGDSSDITETARGYRYRRHPWPVRLMHWVNVLALLFLSGLGLLWSSIAPR